MTQVFAFAGSNFHRFYAETGSALSGEFSTYKSLETRQREDPESPWAEFQQNPETWTI